MKLVVRSAIRAGLVRVAFAWLVIGALAGEVAVADRASAARVGVGGVAATCGKLLPPASGAYFGAFTDFNTPSAFTEDDVRATKIDAFERRAGRKPVWIYFSQSWYRGLAFPRERVLTIWRHGQVPYIAFMPASGVFYGPGAPQKYPEQRFTLQRIIEGGFDAALRAWADAARETNIPILIDFGTEVNDSWGTWNARWNGADQTAGYGDPAYPDGAERFRDAYRHLVTLFRQQEATNVTWFFHADSYQQTEWWNKLSLYYPGDGYVDWLGISVYGNLFPNVPIWPFAAKLDSSSVYTDLTAMSNRPTAIVEMGVVDDAARGKASWIRQAFAAIRSGRFPRLRAATWWNMRSGTSDTRIDSSPAALAAFRDAVADPFFRARLRFTGDCRPATPQGVSASKGSFSDSVLLTWQPVPNATAYEIRRNGALIATTEEPRYDDKLAKPGQRYSYSVRAINPLGLSKASTVRVGFSGPR
jgi:glycosyl hydrolase family 26